MGRQHVCLCWGLTSQSTIFQSCRDRATASWVINQYFQGVKCLAQGHNTAEVGFEPPTSRSGVRHSTTEPLRSPPTACFSWLISMLEITDSDVKISNWKQVVGKWRKQAGFLKKPKFGRSPLLETTISSLLSARCAPFWGKISGVTGQF